MIDPLTPRYQLRSSPNRGRLAPLDPTTVAAVAAIMAAKVDALDPAMVALADSWYPRLHAVALDLAARYLPDVAPPAALAAAAVAIASTSPLCRPDDNVRAVEWILRHWRTVPVAAYPRGIYRSPAAWSHTIYRAVAALELAVAGGDPLDLLALLPWSDKTWMFCRSIIDPFDPDAVTVDGHVSNAARGGDRRTVASAVTGRVWYDTVAAGIAAAASAVGIAPPAYQSRVWHAEASRDPQWHGGQL